MLAPVNSIFLSLLCQLMVAPSAPTADNIVETPAQIVISEDVILTVGRLNTVISIKPILGEKVQPGLDPITV